LINHLFKKTVIKFEKETSGHPEIRQHIDIYNSKNSAFLNMMQSGLVYNVSQEGAASIFTAVPPVLRLLRKWRQQDPSKRWSYKPIYKVHVPEHWSFQKLERENLKPRKEFADFFRSLRLIVQPCDEDDFFFIFPSNEAPVE
jgi:hypothetical protein